MIFTENISIFLEYHLKLLSQKVKLYIKIQSIYWPNETLEYFFINKAKLGRFYLLPKISKRFYNIPSKPVTSSSWLFTEIISTFLEYRLKPLLQKVKSFIKNTNELLKKRNKLRDLPDYFFVCTIDVVGSYTNISQK